MAGRAHEAENIFPGAGKFQGVQRGGGGRAGVTGNMFKIWRVVIEIFGRVETREHCGRVGAEDLFIGRASWCNPIEGEFRLAFQQFDGGRDALRTFGMTGARIAGAKLIGDDGHGDLRYTICDLRAAGIFSAGS